MRRYRLIPNEYLLFYLFRDEVIDKLKKSGPTRGERIAAEDADLFRHLSDPGSDPVAVYEAYLTRREGSYMANESGNARRQKGVSLLEGHASFGYDDVAIMIMRALSGNGAVELPVNISNGDFCPWLEASDVIEVSCRIDREGIEPVSFDPNLSEDLASLIRKAKAYERMTAEAAAVSDIRLARKALSLNPLLADPSKADSLFTRILETQGELLANLR
jgi:6-phospho-beta-glucosidase